MMTDIEMIERVTTERVEDAMRQRGYAAIAAPEVEALLGDSGAASWEDFARSWDDLSLDRYMGDGRRYRRRRFSTFGRVAGPDPSEARATAYSDPGIQPVERRRRAGVRPTRRADHRASRVHSAAGQPAMRSLRGSRRTGTVRRHGTSRRISSALRRNRMSRASRRRKGYTATASSGSSSCWSSGRTSRAASRRSPTCGGGRSNGSRSNGRWRRAALTTGASITV